MDIQILARPEKEAGLKYNLGIWHNFTRSSWGLLLHDL